MEKSELERKDAIKEIVDDIRYDDIPFPSEGRKKIKEIIASKEVMVHDKESGLDVVDAEKFLRAVVASNDADIRKTQTYAEASKWCFDGLHHARCKSFLGGGVGSTVNKSSSLTVGNDDLKLEIPLSVLYDEENIDFAFLLNNSDDKQNFNYFLFDHYGVVKGYFVVYVYDHGEIKPVYTPDSRYGYDVYTNGNLVAFVERENEDG